MPVASVARTVRLDPKAGIDPASSPPYRPGTPR